MKALENSMASEIEETLNPKVIVQPVDVQEAFERFLRLSVADGSASPRTIKAYREGIAVFFKWCKQRMLDPERATFDDVQEYRKFLAGVYARSTCQLRLLAVRVLYQALQRWGMRKDNPADGIRAAKERTDRRAKVLDKALTREETKTLIGHLPPITTIAGARDQAIILLMLLQGLRCEEITNINAEDIDQAAFGWMIVRGKGSKMRKVYLGNSARGALIQWYEKRNGRFAFDNPLFHQLEDGNGTARLSVRTIQRIADKYLNAAGLKRPGRGAHSLRHTYALLAVQGGADREALGDSMGHANLATTDIYIRAAGQLQANPAEKAEAALAEGGSQAQVVPERWL